MKSIDVKLGSTGESSHQIYIGRDILDRMALVILRSRWACRYVVVSDQQVAALHGPGVLGAMRGAGLVVDFLEIPQGESSKDVPTCLDLAKRLVRLGADRSSCLVALGGGVVGDLTGFLASIYMRGIAYIQVPTTLLAQVDSSIGGKTGVDLEEGKNLLGTFYQPRAVFVDLAFLETLPESQIKEGLSEVVKYGLIEEPELLAELAPGFNPPGSPDPAWMEALVERCCLIKKRFVEMDQRDRGIRRILNFGHTVGHALEAASGYSLSHGEGVALGMVAAARLSARLAGLPGEEVSRLEGLLGRLGLPTRIPQRIPTSGVLECMERDKKREGRGVPLVLLKRPGLPFIQDLVPVDCVREVLEELKT